MGLLTCLADSDNVLIADASVAINLNATGHAKRILKALSKRVVVVDVVVGELNEGVHKAPEHADLLDDLVADGLIEVMGLGPVGMAHFESLVIGSASQTLDDGEAATIAYALQVGALALIDERKAIRVCGERFPQLRLGCTVDVLAHDSVQRALAERLSPAILNALQGARMRVLPQHIDWVVKVIGPEQARTCLSLPVAARRPAAKRISKQ